MLEELPSSASRNSYSGSSASGLSKKSTGPCSKPWSIGRKSNVPLPGPYSYNMRCKRARLPAESPRSSSVGRGTLVNMGNLPKERSSKDRPCFYYALRSTFTPGCPRAPCDISIQAEHQAGRQREVDEAQSHRPPIQAAQARQVHEIALHQPIVERKEHTHQSARAREQPKQERNTDERFAPGDKVREDRGVRQHDVHEKIMVGSACLRHVPAHHVGHHAAGSGECWIEQFGDTVQQPKNAGVDTQDRQPRRICLCKWKHRTPLSPAAATLRLVTVCPVG